MRLASPKIPTQKLAETPYLFGEIRHSDQPYIGVPKTSSERRSYLPIGLLSSEVIAGSELFAIPNASLYHFGILCSTMHNAWMRTVCGRLKSDYRYSNTIVYNNFPWPEIKARCAPRTNPSQSSPNSVHSAPNNKHQTAIETAAQLILDERQAEEDRCTKQGQSCSLATLYAAGNMPQGLVKAHAALDKAVDNAYGFKPILSKTEGNRHTDAARVAFLFALYQAYLK